MSITLKTHKMLWGRSGSRCAMSDCRKELVMDATETDDESLIGEECHIVAESPDGPRGDPAVPSDKLNKYDNLILLCRIHHKIIDDQPNTYSVERLKATKALHESWVRESLSTYDQAKQNDDELYASYVDTWLKLAQVENWKVWTSHILGGDHPTLSVEVDESLSAAKEWIFNRIWPRRYPELENSFENFRRVLQDFLNTFHRHSERTKDVYWTEKFYHISEWNEKRYEALFREFIFHVKLVEDLVLELTRAANYICDRVRQFLDRSFRLDEGVLVVQSGPYMDMSWRTHRVEYRGEERIETPYPGLEEFKRIRKGRNFCFGEGVNVEDPDFLEWYKSLD